MIFATVGSMLPFERLVKTMDDWALRHPETPVFCQIGEGQYEPKHMEWARILPSDKYMQMIRDCELIVAHAGTGSVFSAFEVEKPILLVPRYAALKEHTTDHQLHTAQWLVANSGLTVAERDDDIDLKIIEAKNNKTQVTDFPKAAPAPFLAKLRNALLS